MRSLLIVPFAALSMLLVAATCMTVEQRGPGGPWSGEITNIGDQPTTPGLVADVYDASGANISQIHGQSCPSLLLPGETGAYWLPYSERQEGGALNVQLNDQEQYEFPLSLRFHGGGGHDPGFGYQQGDGLLIEEAPSDPANTPTTTIVRVTNNLAFNYLGPLSVCAVRNGPGGELISVAYGGIGGNFFELKPGESTTVALEFPSAEHGATTRYYASGYFDGPEPECCPAFDETTWASIKNQRFSVLLPPGWVYEPDQGIDSFIGTYRGERVELRFDYGWYSNTLPYEDDPAYEVHQETIGGVTAKIARPKGNDGETGVHFVDVQGVRTTDDRGRMKTKLTIVAQDLSAEEQEIALQIFRSVRFSE